MSWSILIVSHGILSLTLFNVPCSYSKRGGGVEIIDLHCCNYRVLLSDLSSKFQSSMTMYHHKLLTREGRVLANG